MSIRYLCPDCSKLLGISGFDAVNEVGRKYCEGCGNNEDYLICADAEKITNAIEKHNKEFNNE